VESLRAHVQSLEGTADKREAMCTSLQEKLDHMTSDLQAKVSKFGNYILVQHS